MTALGASYEMAAKHPHIDEGILLTVYVVGDGKVLPVYNGTMDNWIALGGHVKPNEIPYESPVGKRRRRPA